MAGDFEGERTRRRYERVTGPFDGLLDGPVLVYDLNLGGCFVNSPHQLPGGTMSVLRINLLEEGWIIVNAETLYSLQHGFAVRFPDLDTDTSARIGRTVEARKDRRGF
ncbi:MAG TPA: PilZ domain-containing protein [Vicinamibacterales bacterium]